MFLAASLTGQLHHCHLETKTDTNLKKDVKSPACYIYLILPGCMGA